MPQIKQPSFWLEVKKEYITENFDSLCKYLKAYMYIKEQETADSDFNTTFNCLKEVVYDYFEQAKESSLIKKPSKVVKVDLWFAVKLIASYILTSLDKKEETDYKAIINLANILILEEKVPDNTKEAIKDLIINCICQNTIANLNYSWNNLELIKSNESLSSMAVLLGNIKFAERIDYTLKYEGKGIAVLDKNGLHVAAMNYRAYKVMTNPYVMHLPYNIEIKDDTKTSYNSFSKLHDIIKSIDEKQEKVISVINNCSEEIDDDRFIIVKIDKIIYNVISASPVQESKIQKSGRIEIKVKNHYKLNNLWEQFIKVGDYLKVKYAPRKTFTYNLNEAFDEFYEEYIQKYEEDFCKAIYVGTNNEGWQFLSEHGFMINVKKDDIIESGINDFKYNNYYEIFIKYIKKDGNNNLAVYGKIENIYDFNDNNFSANAKRKIIRAFIDSCDPKRRKQEIIEGDIQKDNVNCLARAIYQLATSLQQTEEKYKLLQVVYMLFRLTNNEKEKDFVKFDKRYIYCLAKFAQGENPKELKLIYNDNLELTQPMVEKIDTIKKLNKYIINQSVLINPNDNLDDKNLLDNLINASNTLIDKINPIEIERIKKRIAHNLGVSDIYVDTTNKENNYGEEGVKLEFKSSFVYPPNNNASPDLRVQKYNVLKSICGMLNNKGGDVLLGVNDYGYARGLDDDLNELFNKKWIQEKTHDKLRLFVAHEIDRAFINFDKTQSGTQITKGLIECSIENDPKIIRINVKPYKLGVVMFKDSDEVPDNVRASAFYRKGGESVKLDERESEDMNKEKRSLLDPDTIKISELKRSIDLKKIVRLINYRSSNSEEIRDRIVEAYQIDETRKTAICFCHDRKAPREFKITRFDEVIITEDNWKYEEKHKSRSVDIFDMHENSDKKPIQIILKLRYSAYNLLIEDFGKAKKDIRDNKEEDCTTYPYILDTVINNILGVGRFYLGLAQAIKIVKGEELKEYAKKYIIDSGLLES